MQEALDLTLHTLFANPDLEPYILSQNLGLVGDAVGKRGDSSTNRDINKPV